MITPRWLHRPVLLLLAAGLVGCRTIPGAGWPHVGRRPVSSEIRNVGRSAADGEQPKVLDVDRPRSTEGRSQWTKLLGRFERPRRIPLPRTDQIDAPPEPSPGDRGVFDF